MHEAGVANLLQHLLRTPADDPKLARLSSAALLVAGEGLSSPAAARGWSTPEREELRAEVRNLNAAWRCFAAGPLRPGEAERVAGPAALHLALQEIEKSVRGGEPIPGQGELVVKVARSLLGLDLAGPTEVEAAVAELMQCAATGRTPSATANEDLCARLATGRASRTLEALVGSRSLARAATLVGGFLGVDDAPRALRTAAFC
mmetsp:Transcript_118106/g.333975  ORF Transcript_118106/g.333975 Transcript_118106/m.333975 type:complete len:204 (+) Transcript_118106:151-762(+)